MVSSMVLSSLAKAEQLFDGCSFFLTYPRRLQSLLGFSLHVHIGIMSDMPVGENLLLVLVAPGNHFPEGLEFFVRARFNNH